MTGLQVWIVIGVPVLLTVVVLLVGGSPVRARIALGLLVGLAALLAILPGAGGATTALLALPVVVLVASGRLEGPRRPGQHQTRHRLTTAARS